ncbi:hypothetical protein SAMN02745945_01390 [Peptoclostridium litorale DSM 5388]|uniref:DUF6873 domain-containing protein n=1 Tax=Peptoclostridium litorale DSM 5388 TaxID=1121324 RepID=A0A069RFI1_PEPLI|nr:hypothetical protein [Peptoclostridium litorale]KDR95543.1 hypothetical protein CLIT_10c02700 [Peptoclostridium litorale DSM 5388]SIN97894.1 hypothetical protein SAMN02745945_01390 [Peptoclostridium litorale DSM 5388]
MKFVEKPFVPDKKVKLALVDPRMPHEMKCFLNDRGIETIDGFNSKMTYEAISGHPDISFCHVGGSKAVASPESFEYYKKELSRHGFEVVRGQKSPGIKYPGNICYNAAIIGSLVIHKLSHTDTVLLDELECNGIKKINVKQGYSKCSICIVGENAIITADSNIHEVALQNGVGSLLIRAGGVVLDGFEYGFIGGSSGLISENEIFFAGDIANHPNYASIMEFLHKNGKDAVCMNGRELLDVGSIIPLKEWM